MCRQNCMWGIAAIAFGLGIFVGQCISSSLLRTFFGLGALVLGICLIRKK